MARPIQRSRVDLGTPADRGPASLARLRYRTHHHHEKEDDPVRHLLLAVACVPLGYGMPEDNLKLVERGGLLRVTGQVMITGGSTRPAYRMEGDTLKVDPRQEGDMVVQAFYPVGIAFDLPKGQRAVRVEVGSRAWQCGK